MTFTLYFVSISIGLIWILWLVQHRSGWDDIPTFRSAGRFLETLPLVSVIMVVKNKNENVTQTVHYLMEQNYPRMEIIVVNDRSSNYSGMRLDELKKWSTRAPKLRIPLRVVHITHLPKDWKGKNYAYYQATKQARGSYLLFIDSAARMQVDTIYSAVDYVTREGVHHLTLLPKLVQRKNYKRVLMRICLFWWSILRQPWKANDELSTTGGIGYPTFNLVRKSAYEEIGTHEAFKRATDESDEMGRLLKEYGYNQRVLYAFDHVTVGGISSAGFAAPLRVGLPKFLYRSAGTFLALLMQLMTVLFPLLGWIPLMFIETGPALILLFTSILIAVTYHTTLKAWELKETNLDLFFLPLGACLLAYRTMCALGFVLKQNVLLASHTVKRLPRRYKGGTEKDGK